MDDDDDSYHAGERCGVDGCRSRRYRTNAQGFEECSNGHQHGLARGDIDNDEDEFLGALRGRRFKKDKGGKEKIYKHLRGKDAVELFLLCYQLVLRKQVWWLIHEKKLPKEVETVVHDLWALRVQDFRTRLNEETQPGTNTEPDANGDSVANLFSSQDAHETEAETDVDTSRPATKSLIIPNLREALALLYMAAQLLRLPILLGDILRWAKSGELLYHDVITELPSEMLQRLSATYRNMLCPQIHLTDGKLLHAVICLISLYNRKYGLEMPALNLPPHLLRLIQELALPLEVYPAVRRLCARMKFNLRYASGSSVRTNILGLPEAQVVAAIAVVLKLFYGFDDIRRVPTTETSPSVAVIDWSRWEEIMKNSQPLPFQEAMHMTDKDAIDLSISRIDDYLDFFEDHFTVNDSQDRDKDADFRKTMLNTFAVQPRSTKRATSHGSSHTRVIENTKESQKILIANRVVSNVEGLEPGRAITRPGQKYEVHRTAFQATGHAESFYRALSQVSGLPYKSIIRAVVHAENMLRKERRVRSERGRPFKYLSTERSGLADPQDELVESDVSMEE